MPTEAERMEYLIGVLQHGMEQECWQCEGSGTRTEVQLVTSECPSCGGSGRVGEGNTFSMICSLCDGGGETKRPEEVELDCDCDGGVIRVPRNAPQIVASVLAGCVSTMYAAREAAEFGAFNEVLDYAHAYVLECLAAEAKQAEENPDFFEATKAMIEKGMEEFVPEERGTKLVGGALTQEDLDQLFGDETT